MSSCPLIYLIPSHLRSLNLKNALYIRLDEIHENLYSVFQNLHSHLLKEETAVWAYDLSTKDKEKLKELCNYFGFRLFYHKKKNRENVVIREFFKKCIQEHYDLWIVNSRVLFSYDIQGVIQHTQKNHTKIGLVGIPTILPSGDFSHPYTYFQPRQSSSFTNSKRKIPLACTFIAHQFLGKINTENLASSKKPLEFYLSQLAVKLGFKIGICSKSRIIQIPKSVKRSKSLLQRLFTLSV